MKHNPGHLGGYLHPRSAATRALVNCAASAGMPGSTTTRHCTRLRHRGRNPAVEKGGPPAAPLLSVPSWPRAIRAVRAWLIPWVTLQRWWPAAACTSTSVTNKLPLS